jgi:hypothetical protein
MLPTMDAAMLMLGKRVIGRLDEICPDMAWFAARFIAAEAFAEVEPLFRRELALIESEDGFDAEGWQQTWEQLWQLGSSVAAARRQAPRA